MIPPRRKNSGYFLHWNHRRFPTSYLHECESTCALSRCPMKQTPWRIYKFGDFSLDERERRLACEGKRVALTPKAFDTLLMLAQHAGLILEKQEMMERIWPGCFVEEATLAQNIFTLRRALGEDANSIRYIETIPRVGYRFICKVEIFDKEEPVLVTTNATTFATLPTIAV